MSEDEPRDEPRDEPPPRVVRLGPLFWLLIAFSAACIVAGFSVARWGPRLLAGL